MDIDVMKHMTSNFSKLNKFKRVDFIRCQKNRHFLLSSMSVVYVLTAPILEDSSDDATVEQIRKRDKWDNDDYVCRGLILKGNKKYFVTFIDDASRFCYAYLLHSKDKALDKFKTKVKLQQRSQIKEVRTDREGERGIECIFVGYAEHSEAFRTRDEVFEQHSYCFNVEDDPKVFDEAIKSHDVAFWKEAINNEMDSIMGNNTWVLAYLPTGCKPLGCKWIFKKTEAILNGDLDEEVYMNQPQGFTMTGNENKAPKQWNQKFDEVVLSNGYLLNQADKCVYSKFDETGKADVILGIRIKHESNEIAISQSYYIKKVVSQLEYSRVIGCLMYVMTCTRPDIAFVVGKLSSWIKTIKDNSSTSGWVFLLGGGVISWASKKQTCITGSTMKSEFVALAAAGKKAEWLNNLLLEIPLWSKPISIHYDSAATLAKAYSHMYNGKSRHLGVRHSMIHELITNEVISIEFVRSQQNLADHLTKGLTRDLVIKSAEGMGLKSN
nr:zinc finger, CCHC-type [Tanacetum cinerariifolium]